MICPGDLVASEEGWDGLPIFSQYQYHGDAGSHGPGVGGRVVGTLGSRDIALALAVVSGGFILIITQQMELGWMRGGCLARVDRFRVTGSSSARRAG